MHGEVGRIQTEQSRLQTEIYALFESEQGARLIVHLRPRMRDLRWEMDALKLRLDELRQQFRAL